MAATDASLADIQEWLDAGYGIAGCIYYLGVNVQGVPLLYLFLYLYEENRICIASTVFLLMVHLQKSSQP